MKENESLSYPLLSSLNGVEDLKKIEDTSALCSEIRKKLIEVISKNGGHLSSNLGITELTVALYKVFSEPENKIIWDVSHQSYVHKMLTGRFKNINSIRLENGISGFTNRKESMYDIFTSGHSSTSISSALGIAQSKKILGEKGKVVAIIGDGALTGGLAYEGLNNVDKLKNFILILNDNKMSISKNIGAIARYLTAARIGSTYLKAKNILDNILQKTTIGIKIEILLKNSKSTLKNLVYKNSIFENMGLNYYGPVDGHDLKQLEKVLYLAKNINKPTVIHVVTSKGKGYRFAEKNPGGFHGVAPFNINTGNVNAKKERTFSQVFGKKLCDIARDNHKVCAITAAMTTGTCLKSFKNEFRSRFFDVGIAEEHAVTFAGGLSAGGLIPVFAIYSSFLQRSYDQLIHDASMQNLKIILAIDRAGFVGEDGEAHQGLFDVPFLNTIPNVKIFSPTYFEELEYVMEDVIKSNEQKVFAIRYPKGSEPFKPSEANKYYGQEYEFYNSSNSETLIITYGRIFSEAYICKKNLEKIGKYVSILKLNVIKPINKNAISECLRFKNIVFFEESIQSGGVAEKFGALLLESNSFHGKYFIHAVNDVFVSHATINSQLKRFLLDSYSMQNIVLDILKES